jgi:excisionase family DNA binding protein
MNTIIEQRFCTTKEFREKYFPISDIKLREMIHREGAPVVRIGRKFLIPIDRFLEWIDKQKIEA